MASASLEFQSVSYCYPTGDPVLSGLSLSVLAGEKLVILGESGCGKSTLLRIAAGLLTPSEGSVLSAHDRASFVFQDAALLPWKTVADNVALPLTLRGDRADDIVTRALADVGLSGLEDRHPAALSGGQRMRVSIARALAAGGSFFCFDEPFAALDELRRFDMNDLVIDLAQKGGWTCLFVTHSLYEACYIADRIIVMADGAIQAEIVPDRSGTKEAEWRGSNAYGAAVKACEQALRGSRHD